MQLGAMLVRLGLYVMRTKGMYDLELIVVPMLLISNGIERLCKVVLYLHAHVRHLEIDHQGLKTHNLVKLVHNVVEHCFDETYRATIYGNEDAKNLLENDELNRVLSILSEYAMKKRYFNLDYVAGQTKNSTGSDDDWGKSFELPRITASISAGKGTPTQDEIASWRDDAQGLIETVVRAFARVLKDGSYREESRVFYKTIRDFYIISDQNLGRATYSDWNLRRPY